MLQNSEWVLINDQGHDEQLSFHMHAHLAEVAQQFAAISLRQHSVSHPITGHIITVTGMHHRKKFVNPNIGNIHTNCLMFPI